MIQRQRLPHRIGKGRTRDVAPLPPVIAVLPPPRPSAPDPGEEAPAILGFPAEFESDDDGGQQGALPLPEAPDLAGRSLGVPAAGAGSEVRLVVVPRSETLGGVALLLAGIATDVSLWLPWWRVSGATGLTLVRQGLVVLGSGVGALGRSGLWQPVAVVLGGGVLFLLGMVLLRRARSHRPAGLLALLATLTAAAGVLVPLADVDWSVRSFGPGMWCAVAVVVLGGLGALKAMLTAPVVSAELVESPA